MQYYSKLMVDCVNVYVHPHTCLNDYLILNQESKRIVLEIHYVPNDLVSAGLLPILYHVVVLLKQCYK